ncbi:hypothetical protein JOD64_000432 [Micromonospora luteifusca]|uniref:DUF5666 domain-containing protein n=1 Tax=Micromonospora luteifusca TaxID=709860 RepID=A0ABS2LM08_9ACTN|nr:hypothetical protein [Micromonospora luteifusca]MBM7489210.1 hypothetical protein [Micromonospora luteifusca]
MAVDLRRTQPLWATAAAVLAVAALSACGSAGAADPVAAPATSSAAAPTTAAPPPIKGKLRGYGTVRQLSETADLVVRGEVEAAGFRVDEVLRAATGSSVRAGARITLASLDGGVADMAHMSKLETGQVVVLYLAQDPAASAFRTLSGDFGVFDVTGSGDDAVAATRSQAMAVSGLLAEDPAASGHGFRTTLGQLRTVAAQVR